MKYTKKSAGIDALILGTIAAFVCIGTLIEDPVVSSLFFPMIMYVVGTVFILSHFYPMESGVLHTSDVLCRKVMIPPHDTGGITWGVFGYVVATVGMISILGDLGSFKQ
ncbi:MAG: hypothetical protein KDN20_18770 [Verrucomicrobiae bacterium]|nr:hypothetical protein [Verrucomicrobiae bacterium]